MATQMSELDVSRPVRPRGFPSWVYRTPELTRLEIERVLLPSWQIVCHISNIPAAGDYVSFELGSESVVVLRDKAGAIRAFQNNCRHRGTRLLTGSGKCHGMITCPYHGWSYQYDGSLLATPVRESFPGLNRQEHGLKPVRVELMLGFVFVCLAANPPPPPSQQWAGMIEELLPYRFEELVPITPMYFDPWEVDWKIAMDNYLESYHVPIGHPGLNRLFTPDYEDQRAVPGIARGISWMRDQQSPRWSERIYQKHVREVTAPHMTEPNRRCWRFYSCLPNLGIDIMPEQVDFFQVLPVAPGKTVIRGAAYGIPDERREMRLIRWLGNRINMQVNKEDKFLCERLQLGMASRLYTPGPLSELECWMLEFHEMLRSRIPELRLPVAPAQFA